ncbi:MAG: methyl-accepting chemotaxis protein [Oscillospiraceae bacterium]|nr:methyl-accepting chemotaxis protein [Oscillospiraceae bacterium]
MIKKLKMGKKMLLGFGIILVLSGIVLIFGITHGQTMYGHLKNFYDVPYQQVNATWQIKEAWQEIQKNMYLASTTVYDAPKKTAFESIQKADDRATQALDILETEFRADYGDKLDALYAQIKISEQYRSEIISLLNQNTEAKNIAAQKKLSTDYNDSVTAADNILDEFSQIAQDNAAKKVSYVERTNRYNTIILSAIGVITLIGSIFLGMRITDNVNRPLKEIERAAKDLAQGNLHGQEITYQSTDELGSLADNMRTTIKVLRVYIEEINEIMLEVAKGNLTAAPSINFKGDFSAIEKSISSSMKAVNDVMAQLNESADQVASGSNQVSAGAQALSVGAAQQANSVDELAATINHISEGITATAHNAAIASKKTSAAGDEVESSISQMKQLVAAIQEIESTSGQIGKIIKTIEDIAFQTNILALNAAVEAARAGTAGKGFAVVADEVRNLASKSAEAAKNTTVLIETSIKAVAQGVELVEVTAKSMDDVAVVTTEMSQIVENIAADADNQATAVTQVTQNIEQIGNVVQNTSATAQQSAAASEELSSQAQMLKGLVSRFTLQKDAAGELDLTTLEYQNTNESSFQSKAFEIEPAGK